MKDLYNRKITYLRVSITDRCDFRCTYCMPEKMQFLPKKDVLSLEEIYRICKVFINKGITKIRITGGEPLVRKNALNIFEKLGKDLNKTNLKELTLTTNGNNLEKYADQLFESGVRRINISLDTLKAKKFKTITRKDNFESVLRGIEKAKRVGLSIKINTVALRGINDDEFDDFIRWCGINKYTLTLIETMPMGEVDSDRRKTFLPLSEVYEDLKKRWTLEALKDNTGGPARYKLVKESNTKLGLITPMSHNFCMDCNRVRLSCAGKLYMCLGQNDSVDLKAIARLSSDDKLIEKAIDTAISFKPKEHDFSIKNSHISSGTSRQMSVTGG